MEREDVAILVNSTPKYYYILPFFFGMLRRYAPGLRWPVILATEVPDHEVCVEVAAKYDVELLEIPAASAGFIDSRWAALNLLKEHGYRYVLPLQDDFILEMPMDAAAIERICKILDYNPDIASVRLMPCPGPAATDAVFEPGLRVLSRANDEYGFTYQATLWRWGPCLDWFKLLSDRLQFLAPRETTEPAKRIRLEVTGNIAENGDGQQLFWGFSGKNGWTHIAWERLGPQPNAVYLSPFPYRPTAIVRGSLGGWAAELAKREGFSLEV